MAAGPKAVTAGRGHALFSRNSGRTTPGMAGARMSARIVALAIGLLLFGTALARGPWRASEANSRGWQFMSPEERIEHQTRIRGFRTLEDCQDYQTSHHRLMEERARLRGVALPGGGRDICEHLRPGKAMP